MRTIRLEEYPTTRGKATQPSRANCKQHPESIHSDRTEQHVD